MPDRVVAEAVAELRLTDDRLTTDFQNVRRQLLQAVSRLEDDLAIGISAFPDASFESAVGGVEALIDDPPIITTAFRADSDELSEQLTLIPIETDPVMVPFEADLGDVAADVQPAIDEFQQTVGPPFDDAGVEAGTSFAAGFSRSLQAGLTTASIAGGAFLATSLFEGFQRFTTIEDSIAGLTVQLDSASEAGKVLDDVLTVVRGTPFNLDQFAQASTQLISFGVEAEKVPAYLTAIGEAAATRGSQANDFAQRLSTIFGQITAIGRISGEDIWSFSDVGVNALAILGNTLNKTTEEIRDMVSEGAIPAEFALDALSFGILNGTDGVNGATKAFAGTMEGLRETLAGAIGGFESARARLGVAIIEPLSDSLRDGFNAATDIIDNFTTRTDEAFTELAASPAVEGFIEFFQRVPDLIDPAIDTLSEFSNVLAPLSIALGSFGLGGLSNALGSLGFLIPGVQSLAGAATVAAAAFAVLTPEIRDELIPIVTFLGEQVAQVTAVGVKVLSDAVEDLTPVVETAIEVFEDFLPLIEIAVDLGSAIALTLSPAIGGLADVIEEIPVEILTATVAAFLGFRALSGIQSLIASTTTRITALGTATVTKLGEARTAISQFSLAGIQNLRTIQGSAQIAAVGIGGVFSGIALGAEDASARIAGAAGAITSVLTGLATGGLIGGGTALVGVGIGLLVDDFLDAQREAEALERSVEELADTINREFAEDELVDFSGIISVEGFDKLVRDTFDQGDLDLLQALGLNTDILRDELDGTEQEFNAFIDGLLDTVVRARVRQTPLDLADILGTRSIQEFLDEVEDAGGIFARDESLRNVFSVEEGTLFDLIREVGPDLEAIERLYGLVTDAQGLAAQNATLFNQETKDGADDAAQSLEEQQKELVDVGLGYTDAGELAALFGEGATSAIDEANQALEAFNSEIDRLRGKLNLDVELQNLDAELRDFGASLTGIINEDDIAEADGIREDISRSRDRIADLRVRLTEENIEGDELRADLNRRIAEAEAIGADPTRLLQKLALVGVDAQSVQNQIDDEFAKIAELEGRLSGLSTVPITLLQEVELQAAEAGLSLFEFALAGPTPEARAFFQDGLVSLLLSGLDAAEAVAEKEGAIPGARQAEAFIAGFEETLGADLGEDFIGSLLDRYISDESRGDYAAAAAEAAAAVIQSVVEQFELGPDDEFPTVPVGVDGQDLEELFTELETFLAEEAPDVSLSITPVLDEEQAQADWDDLRENLQQFDDPYNVELALDLDQAALDEAQAELDGAFLEYEPPPVFVPVGADLRPFDDALNQIRLDNASGIPGTIGAITESGIIFKEGGIHGVTGVENRYAQIATGYRMWAEPETGGEAYIPLAESKRPRSMSILEQVANIFNVGLAPKTVESSLFQVDAPIVHAHASAPPVIVHAADAPAIHFAPIIHVAPTDPKVPMVTVAVPAAPPSVDAPTVQVAAARELVAAGIAAPIVHVDGATIVVSPPDGPPPPPPPDAGPPPALVPIPPAPVHVEGGVDPASLQKAVSAGIRDARGIIGADHLNRAVVMKNYFPDGTKQSKRTARDIRLAWRKGEDN